MTKDKHYICV